MTTANWVRGSALATALLLAIGSACGTAKPKITVTSPAHGTFTTAPSVTLTGTIANAKVAGHRVEVNGNVAVLNPDKTWSITLPTNPAQLLNPYLARLVRNSDARVLARERVMLIHGQSVADGGFSLNSVALRISDPGLDQIEPLIEDGVALDPATLIPLGTTVISGYCAIPGLFGTCLGRVDARIASPAPSITGFSIDADSMTGFVAGDVDIHDLRVNLDIIGSGLAPSCGLRIDAANTQILGDYALSPDSLDPSYVDVNQLPGSLLVSFQGFGSEFTSGLCDFPLIGDLIQLIIGDVQPIVRNGLQSFLQDPDGAGPADAPVAEAIESALADISISGPIGETLQVNLETPLFAVAEDPNGVTLGSDTRITSSAGAGPGQCQPPAGTPNLAASYHVAEAFPAFGATTPVGDLPYHIGLAISTSAFNQLLKSQIECGLLRTTLTEIDLGSGPQPVTAGFLTLFLPTLSTYDPDLPMQLELKPTLAPFLTGNPGPGGAIGEIVVPQLQLDVRVTHPSNPLVIRGTIDFRAGLGLAFDEETGSLVFSVGDVQDVVIAFLENNASAAENQVANVLGFFLPDLLPSLGAGLGAFPLPAFLGLQLESVEVSRNGQFYSLFANLVPGP